MIEDKLTQNKSSFSGQEELYWLGAPGYSIIKPKENDFSSKEVLLFLAIGSVEAEQVQGWLIPTQ